MENLQILSQLLGERSAEFALTSAAEFYSCLEFSLYHLSDRVWTN